MCRSVQQCRAKQSPTLCCLHRSFDLRGSTPKLSPRGTQRSRLVTSPAALTCHVQRLEFWYVNRRKVILRFAGGVLEFPGDATSVPGVPPAPLVRPLRFNSQVISAWNAAFQTDDVTCRANVSCSTLRVLVRNKTEGDFAVPRGYSSSPGTPSAFPGFPCR